MQNYNVLKGWHIQGCLRSLTQLQAITNLCLEGLKNKLAGVSFAQTEIYVLSVLHIHELRPTHIHVLEAWHIQECQRDSAAILFVQVRKNKLIAAHK
jgi:hypothetical protein